MIRKAKYQNKEYLIVDTELHIYNEGEKIIVPIHLQANIAKIISTNHYVVYKALNALYNSIKVVGKKPETPKKSWCIFWKSK